ncbi:MAG TPA: universal stress protein [Burkholderiaceae bacterium]|nr:universal stress protein [Burkholderiaceae bacterium]
MFSKILVPTDGSELSVRAVQAAVELASKLGARIVGVTVVEPYAYASLSEYRPETVAEYEQRADEVAQERLSTLERLAQKGGVPVETTVVRSFSPFDAIIETATRYGCDAICMASHGRRGLGAVLLGSETQKVLTHSSVPVIVYR